MAKVLLVTDAWGEQVNGVVTTLSNLVNQARKNGDKIYVYHPGRCGIRFSLPTYKEIEIGIPNPIKVRKLLKKQNWDYIHISTPEAPIGMTFSKMCNYLGIPFSVSCHTKFPEFVNFRYPWISVDLGWKYMRFAYKGASSVLTTTDSMAEELRQRGITQPVYTWSRGVDRSIFHPLKRREQNAKTKIVCVSRASHEKGLDDFCKLNYPQSDKILVGDGPYLNILKKKYPDVTFVGKKTGSDLAYYYQTADVFVFPSKADTFGVVIIEAIACGTPVIAYDVTGPKDIIVNGKTGYLTNESNDLNSLIKKAIELDREKVFDSSLKWSWEECYKQFFDNLLYLK